MVSTLITWVTTHKTILASLIGGSAALSVALETLLTKLHINSKKLAFTLLHLLSGGTALVAWYTSAVPATGAVGIYAGLALVAQIWHRFIVSPANEKYLMPFLQYLTTQKAAQAIKQTPPPATPDQDFTA